MNVEKEIKRINEDTSILCGLFLLCVFLCGLSWATTQVRIYKIERKLNERSSDSDSRERSTDPQADHRAR
jgi:uncharacterized membrane protein YciS (DUF1049 family)